MLIYSRDKEGSTVETVENIATLLNATSNMAVRAFISLDLSQLSFK
jgi:hypothetical protein